MIFFKSVSIKTKEIATSLEHSVWGESNQSSSAMVTRVWLQNKSFFTVRSVAIQWDLLHFNCHEHAATALF